MADWPPVVWNRDSTKYEGSSLAFRCRGFKPVEVIAMTDSEWLCRHTWSIYPHQAFICHRDR